MKDKYSKYLLNSAGRYQVKPFREAQCRIVERLVNSIMMHGRSIGKKLMTVRIVKHSFEIIHLCVAFCNYISVFKYMTSPCVFCFLYVEETQKGERDHASYKSFNSYPDRPSIF